MFEGFQVYSDKASSLFGKLPEAVKFARKHSKENPGMTVLLCTHWDNFRGRMGGRTLGFYIDGKRLVAVNRRRGKRVRVVSCR